MRILIAVILLLIVGCTGVVHANQQATEDEDRIANLEAQVRELQEGYDLLYEEAVVHEEHIRTIEWRDEQQVVHVVIDEVWQRLKGCSHAECYHTDPMLSVLYELRGDDPERMLKYGIDLLLYGYWWGERVSETEWYVYAQYDENTRPIVFIVNSTYRTMCWEGANGCPPQDSEPEY
jgi:hypothetical protein